MTGKHPDQLERLAGVDWDLLIVLDAVRWDIWDDMVGEGEPVWSAGSCTPQWVKETLREFDFRDTVCVTSNPEVTRKTMEDLYFDREDLWKSKWEYINGIGTVPQEAVTKAVQRRLTVGPDKRVYGHWPGAHGPYPRHEPPIPVMRNNPEAADVKRDEEYMPDQIIMNPTALLNDDDRWLTVEMLRDAYRANLEWAWESIQPLLFGDETVVVTADHGEILGELLQITGGRLNVKLRYGHPCDSSHPKLRVVPFAVFD